MQSGSSDLPPCELRLKTVGERVSHSAAESLGKRCTVPSCALPLSGPTPPSPLPHRPGRRCEGGGHASALSRGLLFAGLTARWAFLRRGGVGGRGGTTNLCVFCGTLHRTAVHSSCSYSSDGTRHGEKRRDINHSRCVLFNERLGTEFKYLLRPDPRAERGRALSS